MERTVKGRCKRMRLNNEICISFLRGSGWLYNHDKEIAISERNKAIDDFVKFANTMPTVEEEDGTIRPMWLEEIAEQLKAGAGNDKSI